MLAFAKKTGVCASLVQGDARALPFPAASFDVVLCHYLLLWLADPAQGVREMARVVRPGGRVLACAEPDYGGRIDHPPELAQLGQLQAEALRRQGADPKIGRRLGELVAAAGLQATVGTIAGQWRAPSAADAGFAAEWDVRRHDLAGLVTSQELERLQDIDRQALESGERTLFVPTFFASGRKPMAN
jgi:SAM-dependent methyltransferase